MESEEDKLVENSDESNASDHNVQADNQSGNLLEKYRALILAEAASPELVSVPLVGWSISSALISASDSLLVTQIRNKSAIERAGLVFGTDFDVIDTERIERPLYWITTKLRGGANKAWTLATAVKSISYYYFEYLLWRKYKARIMAGEFDIVHRVTPLSPTTPSLLARKCKKAGVPFVLGPINGGVPWPKGFSKERHLEKEWLSYVRDLYKLLPGYRSTLESTSALIVGSTATMENIPSKYHPKCIYIPENGIDLERFNQTTAEYVIEPLRVCFIGRLVPYKCPDVLVNAAIPLVKNGNITVDILGDGPMFESLRAIIEGENLSDKIRLHGWVEHREVQNIVAKTNVLGFPSVREFGGGVVLEAMSIGVVPVVINYAGPGDLVSNKIGIKIPIGTKDEITINLRSALAKLCANPELTQHLRENAIKTARDYFTWQAKAQQIGIIYDWVTSSGTTEKPLPITIESGVD